MKIQQREEATLPFPVMDPTGDIEILTRRVAALEGRTASLGSICASLMWVALTRREAAAEREDVYCEPCGVWHKPPACNAGLR